MGVDHDCHAHGQPQDIRCGKVNRSVRVLSLTEPPTLTGKSIVFIYNRQGCQGRKEYIEKDRSDGADHGYLPRQKHFAIFSPVIPDNPDGPLIS